MYTVVPIFSHVQTDINDQIIAVTAIQWWYNNGPFLDGSEEQKKKEKKQVYTWKVAT